MKDKIVELVKADYDNRSRRGIKKYNTTLCKNDKDDFLQHLYEELLDASLYIRKLQTLKVDEDRVKGVIHEMAAEGRISPQMLSHAGDIFAIIDELRKNGQG